MLRFFTALGLLIASSLAAQTHQPETIIVNDPRPLAEAAREFEKRCHCVVTYEDLRWRADQVEPAPTVVPRPGKQRPLIPRGFTFGVTVPTLRTTDDVEGALQEMLAEFHQRANAATYGEFHLLGNDHGFHIEPGKRAILDTPVSLAISWRPLTEVLDDIARQIKSATGENVFVLAVGSLNWLLHSSLQVQARNERAGDVLSRGLVQLDRQLSWQLLYDFPRQNYYLNIHRVQ